MLWSACIAAAHYVRKCLCIVVFIVLKKAISGLVSTLQRHGVQFEEVMTPDGRRVLRVVKPRQEGEGEPEGKRGVQSTIPGEVWPGTGLAQVGEAAMAGIDKVREAVRYFEEHEQGDRRPQRLEEGNGEQEGREKVGRWGGVSASQEGELIEIASKFGGGKRTKEEDKDEKHTRHWDLSQPSNSGNGDHKKESGDIDRPLANIFDERPSALATRDFFRPIVSSAASGDSIGSDDPFLPPGLSNLALSLTPRRTFSGTCIQPGSTAASSSRSRMSFAKFLRGDESGALEQKSPTPRPTKPLDNFGVPKTIQRSRFAPISENVPPSKIINTPAIANAIAKKNDNTTVETTTADVKSPTQIYRALSALSFWTPAPKVTVKIAAPVKRRRGGRRKEKEREKEKEKAKECASHEIFEERMVLREVTQN